MLLQVGFVAVIAVVVVVAVVVVIVVNYNVGFVTTFCYTLFSRVIRHSAVKMLNYTLNFKTYSTQLFELVHLY